MNATKFPLTFQIYKGATLVRTETLTVPQIRVGTLPSAHLKLDDPQASRLHALVEVDELGRVSVSDLGSTKGTFVNGKRIGAATTAAHPTIAARGTLRSGDSLTIGDTRIVVTLEAAPAKAATPPPPPPPLPPMRVVASPLGSERMIQVTARLDNEVVAEKTVTKRAGGKLSALTLAVLAAGLVGVLSAAAVFAHGVKVARANKRGLEAFVEAGGDEIDFLPRRLHPLWNVLFMTGVTSGLAGFAWGIARARGERRSPGFTIGAGQDFAVAGPAFTLVAPKGPGFVFAWRDGMEGELVAEGKTTPLAELPRELTIPADARVNVRLGRNSFEVASLARPRARTLGMLAGADKRPALFLVGSAMVALVLVWVLKMFVPFQHQLSEDSDPEPEAREVAIQLPAPKEDKIAEVDETTEGGIGGPAKENTDTGAAMEGPEGKLGEDVKVVKDGKIAIKNRGEWKTMGSHKSDSRERMIEAARNAAPIRILADANTGRWAAVLSPVEYSSGFDSDDIVGGLHGDRFGDARGNGGFGDDGTGWGGGGLKGHPDTIGVTDNDGRIGRDGRRIGTRIPWGPKGPGGGPRDPKVPVIRPDRPQVDPRTGIDEDTVKRYLRRKLASMSYCYQRELAVKPQLGGTLTVTFLINGNGRVTTASAKGFDPQVSSCVRDVVAAIAFPRADDGGDTHVRYPVVFRPAGR